MAIKLHPAAAAVAREFIRVTNRALSAAVAEGLKAVGEVTEEADRRVKRGARAAEKMAKGHPYDPDDDEYDDEDS